MKLFDMHCDTLYEIAEKGGTLRDNDAYHISLDRAKGCDLYAQFFALFCGGTPPEDDGDADRRLRRMLQVAREQFAQNADRLTLCHSARELDAIFQKKKIAAFLTVEGADLLPNTDALQLAYDAGVRLVTITWNHRNRYGCPAFLDQSEGLTEAGRQFAQACEERGILLDVSHLSDRGFWDLCETAERPFAASHSNAREVCNVFRNLTREQTEEIIRRGGVIGLNLCPAFLHEDGDATGADIDDIDRHLYYFLSHGGEKTVCLGADFDGVETLPRGIEGVQDMERLYEALLKRRYSQALLDGLFFENLAVFIRRIL